MSYGFTKDAGPTSRPLEQNPFTQFQFNRSLSPPSATTHVFHPQSFRVPDPRETVPSPPLAFESTQPIVGPSRSSSSPTPNSVSGSSFVLRTVQSYDEGWLLANTNDIDAEVAAPKPASFRLPKKTRSPPLRPEAADQAFQGTPYFHQYDTDAPSLSPPRPVSGSNLFSSTVPIHNQRRLLAHTNDIDGQPATSKPAGFPLAKRTRSPPLTSADQTFEEKSYLSQCDTDAYREMQAKAKRLARFKVELSQEPQKSPEAGNQNISAKRQDQSVLGRHKLEHSAEVAQVVPNANALSDFEGLDSSRMIIGLCPDMCPESEREERERKGDLDPYERLDGDRNQTSKFLAVKKYNRTAERDADLIRPMPILQKTVDYLLNLLNQAYDEKFLGTYNFLWDRMRAIRMDLRMQHIFNLEAIKMLEQMIKLHIIAMHELCEYTKGEGFAEGFDAHLNIEQMNKTSVELFQMYDDHRKRGIVVPTEKEFRGYYALLKLDKHPGYRVEPAELSLDLAKMTTEMRQTPEVLFARDVARACRTGNFIAFFRLAKKASYLQACLMHAHFSKLRTQALASLHAGLQNNQGLPVTHVAKWLGMEEEDIENLLEYHGFSIKNFEEPYMVKEAPFLNADNEYPTKCSKLVQLKKSNRIIEDVLYPFPIVSVSAKELNESQLNKAQKQQASTPRVVKRKDFVHSLDDEMLDAEPISSANYLSPIQPLLKPSTLGQPSTKRKQVASPAFSPPVFSMGHDIPSFQLTASAFMDTKTTSPSNIPEISQVRNDNHVFKTVPLQIVPTSVPQEKSIASYSESSAANSTTGNLVIMNLSKERSQHTHQEENNEIMEANYDEEVAGAKLKLFLRIWKRRASKRRELREKKHLAALAALDSLPLGPPIYPIKELPSTFHEFNIDRVARERFEKHARSWSRLNVSDVVADTLEERNLDARCLCWKIIVCFQAKLLESHGSRIANLAASSWLPSKLMPCLNDEYDEELVISSPGLSIWKRWFPSQHSAGETCCLSVVKDANFEDINLSVSGASAVLFLVSDSVSWELQKKQLYQLVTALPADSSLPLLILSVSHQDQNADSASEMANKLGLHNIDKSYISCFSIISLFQDQKIAPLNGFFSDEKLREGLKWLASESPVQPVLYKLKTRELVLDHLNSSLEGLNHRGVNEVDPGCFVLAFNNALDHSLTEILAVSEANPSDWPCPEIDLLKKSTDEHYAVACHLPVVGWSSSARIEPYKNALRKCKLPNFSHDISWLNRGCKTGEEIKNQRLQLKNCLVMYLNQLIRTESALIEAEAMIHSSVRMKFWDSTYHIFPNWVEIFRRVFNWQLESLTRRAVSLTRDEIFEVYVLKQSSVKPDAVGYASPYLLEPSLDEMLEVVCSTPLHVLGSSERKAALEPPPRLVYERVNFQEAASTNGLTYEDQDAQDGERVEKDDGGYLTSQNYGSSTVLFSTKAASEADNRLDKLLDRCNILQDRIDEQLSFYFGYNKSNV